MEKPVRCPRCGGTNIQVPGNDRKGFSAAKAIGRALLAVGIGLLAGFAGKTGKYEVFRADCGQRFQAKRRGGTHPCAANWN